MIDSLRRKRWRAALAVLAMLVAAPASAQRARAQDLWITVFSSPGGVEQVAVAYNRKIPEAEIRQDLAQVAQALKLAPPQVKVSSGGGIPIAETELSGLTDWRTGAINLDPFIQSYRRYGRFGITFLFLGNFPLPPLQNIDRPPLRITAEPHGSAVSFRVEVDQSRGVPQSLPSAAQGEAPGWRMLLGIGAMALVVAVSVFLVVMVIVGGKRGRRAVPGMDEEPEAAQGGAAREGKR